MAQCAIGLGSNLGDSQLILNSALAILDRTPGICVTVRSSYYQTQAIGPPQPDYLNACALLETTFTPQELLKILQQIETDFGRVRRERWGARTLDLDLLLFDRVILHTTDLEIPHPRLIDRAFVLVPLSEIAPGWIEPISGHSIAQLVQRVEISGVKKISF